MDFLCQLNVFFPKDFRQKFIITVMAKNRAQKDNKEHISRNQMKNVSKATC